MSSVRETAYPNANAGHKPASFGETLLAATFLLALLSIFFWPAVFGGQVLLPADVVYDLDPLWQSMSPDGYAGPSNHVLSDQVTQFYPWRVFSLHWLARGYLPLWNPHVNAGQPFVGNAQSALFDPFNWVGYLADLAAGSTALLSPMVRAILRLLTAGVFTYLFAREIGVRPAGALLAMVAFSLSGPMVGWVGYPLASVIAWFPAMLWTLERALIRAGTLAVAWCGLTIGLQFLGGHPESSFLALLAWGAYALYRGVYLGGWRWGNLRRHLGKAASAASIGLGLGAIQLLPFLDAVSQSGIVSARKAEAAVRSSSVLSRFFLEWHSWPTAATLLLPRFFGTPLDESYLYPYSNYLEQNAYVGILPLALAVTATVRHYKLPANSQRSQVLFWALLGLVSLGLAIRLPLLNIVNYLPLFQISASGRLRLVFAFALSLLAGLGLDGIVADLQGYRQLVLRALTWTAVISAALIGLTYLGLVLFQDEITHFGRAYIDGRWGTPYFSRPLEHYYALVDHRYARTLAQFSPANVVMYLPVLVAITWRLTSIVARIWRLRPLAWTWVALGLTIGEAFMAGTGFNPVLPQEDLFPKPDAISFLERDRSLYRVCATDLILYPNFGMVFGLHDVRGYESVAPGRYSALIDRLSGHFRFRTNSLFSEISSPLLSLLNVKYVFTHQELGPPWEQVHQQSGGIRLYRNREVMPRAFMVYKAEVAASPEDSLNRVTAASFDFRSTVVLEERPAAWVQPSPTADSFPTVEVVEYLPNQVSIEVQSDADGLLVLTDSYMVGWRALLDGQRIPLYVADHAFRAVVVPAGAHRVEFAYYPPSFQIGVALTLATVVAVALAHGVVVTRRAKLSSSRRAGDL